MNCWFISPSAKQIIFNIPTIDGVEMKDVFRPAYILLHCEALPCRKMERLHLHFYDSGQKNESCTHGGVVILTNILIMYYNLLIAL